MLNRFRIVPLELLARRYDIHENIVWIFTEVERNLVFRLFTQNLFKLNT